MAEFESNVFENQTLHLDGHKYVNNTFKDCTLIYGGGPLHFNENKLFNVRWEFIDSAARTLSLLSSFYQSGEVSREFVMHILSTFGKQGKGILPKKT